MKHKKPKPNKPQRPEKRRSKIHWAWRVLDVLTFGVELAIFAVQMIGYVIRLFFWILSGLVTL
ncbi:MAG: hypothetical protein ACPGRD_12065, partial [Planktomarina sp.]